MFWGLGLREERSPDVPKHSPTKVARAFSKVLRVVINVPKALATPSSANTFNFVLQPCS